MLLDSGVTIQALPGFADGQKLLNIDDANAVQVIGYGASLAMNRAEYKSGEYRHCLSITGSNLVVIKGISCVNSGGNGVYVGGSDRKKFSEDVILEDLNTTNSLSAGLKIASARNVTIRRSRFEGSHGFEPSGSKKAADRASGIELYPGGASRLENIRLEDTVTAHNAGDGIRIVLSRLLHTGPAVSVTILRHRDTAAGGSSFLGIDDPPSRQAVSGQIMFEDCSSEAAQEYGAVFSFWNSSGPRVSFIRLTVIDPNSAGTTMNNAAVAVKRGGGGHEPIGNVEFAYTTICDTRRHPKLDYYFTIADYSHIGIHNVIFRDAVKLTGARHKEPLGLYQGEGIAGIQRADDPAVRALWQNLEKHDSAKHERGQ